ncbi:MAG TPA: pantetheine-phosphate adenylyltransferase [Candidatus Saccharimonadales bacterium]|nr:pantetheine-phosphate adenylyltransferase [Candidatus Saccharimonadales bacterium]
MAAPGTSGAEASAEVGPKVLYGGSFDPPTLGHLDLITKAAAVFPHVEVNLAVNPEKDNGYFKIPERLELLRAITADLDNVAVEHLPSGFLVGYAEKNGFAALVRGLRSERDFGSESDLYKGNRLITPNVQTIYFPSEPALDMVSSTMVKVILAANDPDWQRVVSQFVPEPVMDAIVAKETAAEPPQA